MEHRRFLRSNIPMLTAVVSAILAAPLGAQSSLPAYTPQKAQYRVVTNSHSVQSAMGQSQESDTKSAEVLTVAIVKNGTGLSMTMTLDSVAQTTTAPMPLPDASAAIGLKFSAAMDPDGHVATSVVTDKAGNPSDSPLATSMRSFLPRLKVGATVGTSWVDTTNSTRQQGGGTVTTMMITTYKLAGDTTMSGAKQWKISSTSVGKVSGNGNQNGADFTIKGDITGTGILMVGTDGALTAANSTNDVNLLVDVPMAGMQIPITQQDTRTITRVP